MRAWALSHGGISWDAHWDIADDLAAGRLVELLPEYQSSLIELFAVDAPGKPVPPRIGLFVDYMLRTMRQFAQDNPTAPVSIKESIEPD